MPTLICFQLQVEVYRPPARHTSLSRHCFLETKARSSSSIYFIDTLRLASAAIGSECTSSHLCRGSSAFAFSSKDLAKWYIRDDAATKILKDSDKVVEYILLIS